MCCAVIQKKQITKTKMFSKINGTNTFFCLSRPWVSPVPFYDFYTFYVFPQKHYISSASVLVKVRKNFSVKAKSMSSVIWIFFSDDHFYSAIFRKSLWISCFFTGLWCENFAFGSWWNGNWFSELYILRLGRMKLFENISRN